MADEKVEDRPPSERERFEFEKRKFEAEHRLATESRQQQVQAQRLEQWKSPIILAIVGGVISLVANTVTGYLNNRSGQELEDRKFANTIRLEQQKTEAELIKRFLEPEEQAQRLSNLRFLADSGLLPTFGEKIGDYVARNPESLPRSLPVQPPAQAGAPPAGPAIDRKMLDMLVAAQATMVTVEQRFGGREWARCSGFFVDPARVITAAYCVPGALEPGDGRLADLRVSRGTPGDTAPLQASSVEIRGHGDSFRRAALITIADPPAELPLLARARTEPREGERLTLVYAPRPGEFAAAFDDACRTLAVGADEISYRCDATTGSAGGAVVSMETGELLAVHTFVDTTARHGLRLDRLGLD